MVQRHYQTFSFPEVGPELVKNGWYMETEAPLFGSIYIY